MFITDKIWEHLLPAVETTNEGMAREDFEKGIQDGIINCLLIIKVRL